jgi:hypothetical protein
MNSTLIPLFFCLLAAAGPTGQEKPAPATESIISSVDIPAWVESRWITIRQPALETGSLDDLFDTRPATTALCAKGGPATFEFFFREPFEIHQIGITPYRGAAYRWQAFFSPAPDQEGRFVFQPLVAQRNTSGGDRDPVRIGKGRKARALRIEVERMTNGERPLLSELEIYGRITIRKLVVKPPPAPLVAGGNYRFDVYGLDSHGGRTSLEKGLKWTVFPQKKIVSIGKDGTLHALAHGKVEARLTFGKLKHKPIMVTIAPLAPPPGSLIVAPCLTSVALGTDFDLPADRFLLFYRRDEGALPPGTLVHRSPSPFFNDAGLAPGTVYHYSAALADRRGTVLTERTPDLRVRTLPGDTPPCLTATGLEVIVPIYGKEMDPGQVGEILTGLRLARTFFYRNSRGRLVLFIRPVLLDAPLPAGAGPLLFSVEHDLESRGFFVSNPGLIHVIGAGTKLNCGGGRMAGGTALSFGFTARAPAAFPNGPFSRTARDTCWTFIHEFQHSLDDVVNEMPGAADMLHGHFLDNYPLPQGTVFDAGDFYDGQAAILRAYGDFDAIGAPFGTRLEACDSDGDGLPDDDPRWPADENRLATGKDAADSDGDGLTDLAEFCAGIYSGTDPTRVDSDGDGVPDGQDPFPLSDFSGVIPFGTPPDGAMPEALLSSGVSFLSSEEAPGDVRVYASWDEDALFIGFDSTVPLRVEIFLDGSGRLGPFASDRLVKTAGDGQTAGERRGDVYRAESSLRATFGQPLLAGGSRPLEEGLVSSWRDEERYLLLVRVPAAAGGGSAGCHIPEGAPPSKGLTLCAGRVIGLNATLTLHRENNDHNPENGKEGCFSTLYELHRFYDAVLRKP